MMPAAAPVQRLFSFVGGPDGPWRVDPIDAIIGAVIPSVPRVDLVAGSFHGVPADAGWALCGLTSNERYVVRDEKAALVAAQEGLGRERATRAALIPIRKTAAWWALAQDERRDIFEAQSRHIAIGTRFLPAVARRLQHCRDLDPDEPFDFLTWFESAPADATAFDMLLADLRASPEWRYIDREVDIRLVRDGG